jgi:hypothetical protein
VLLKAELKLFNCSYGTTFICKTKYLFNGYQFPHLSHFLYLWNGTLSISHETVECTLIRKALGVQYTIYWLLKKGSLYFLSPLPHEEYDKSYHLECKELHVDGIISSSQQFLWVKHFCYHLYFIDETNRSWLSCPRCCIRIHLKFRCG